MQRFGLIGKSLQHSFSQKYFSNKFQKLNLTDCHYDLFELNNIEEISKIFSLEYLKGLNVTIPYKQNIIPFLTKLNEAAQEIGAVNCIKIKAGEITGFNTDAYGFQFSLKPFLTNLHGHALILGTGGSSKAVAYVLKNLGINYFFVTSKDTKENANTFFYNELNDYVIKHFKLIVNCTPIGMYPNTEQAPTLPYEHLTSNHLCYDLIYNPTETEFLKRSKQNGASIINGLNMLQLQAEKSWEIWQS